VFGIWRDLEASDGTQPKLRLLERGRCASTDYLANSRTCVSETVRPTTVKQISVTGTKDLDFVPYSDFDLTRNDDASLFSDVTQ
jgi:hypothetical protein